MKTNTENSLAALTELLPRFEALEDYSEPSVEEVIKSILPRSR